MAAPAHGDGQASSYSSKTDIVQNLSSESVKVGNTKTKNYNIHESNYKPTQLTQVVLNVPKLYKKLRRTRPPTPEELGVKQKILDVYQQAREEAGVYLPSLEHLGAILEALNPKYISTERVVLAAFANELNYKPTEDNSQASEQDEQMAYLEPITLATNVYSGSQNREESFEEAYLMEQQQNQVPRKESGRKLGHPASHMNQFKLKPGNLVKRLIAPKRHSFRYKDQILPYHLQTQGYQS